MLDAGDIQKSGVRGWIDQQIEVAPLPVIAMKHRSKHARIAGVVLLDDAANLLAVEAEGFGRFHDVSRAEFSERTRSMLPLAIFPAQRVAEGQFR